MVKEEPPPILILTEHQEIAIKMRHLGATYDAIGKAIGKTRQYARVLILDCIAKGLVATPFPEYWRPIKAAKVHGIGVEAIHRLCRQGEVDFINTPDNTRRLLITARGMEQLAQHPAVLNAKRFPCKTCGQDRRHVDHQQCHVESRRQLFQRIYDSKPTQDTLTGWHLTLYQQLKKQELKHEAWITEKPAMLITGLTAMQITYLRKRQLITVMPHPDKKSHKGKPVAMYAVSELEIVRDVYAIFIHEKHA